MSAIQPRLMAQHVVTERPGMPDYFNRDRKPGPWVST
jgi:hypothetical protein